MPSRISPNEIPCSSDTVSIWTAFCLSGSILTGIFSESAAMAKMNNSAEVLQASKEKRARKTQVQYSSSSSIYPQLQVKLQTSAVSENSSSRPLDMINISTDKNHPKDPMRTGSRADETGPAASFLDRAIQNLFRGGGSVDAEDAEDVEVHWCSSGGSMSDPLM